MDRFPRRLLALVSLLALMPMSAQATLMEFGWRGRWGEGVIIYDNSVADADPMKNSWFFRNSIVSYDIQAFVFLDAYYFKGEGGSIGLTAFPPRGECPDTPDAACWVSSFVFYLGPPPTDGSPRYQMNIVDVALPITPDGWLPGPGEEESPPHSLSEYGTGYAYIISDQSPLRYGTMNNAHRFWNRPVAVAFVPEPGAWSLTVLGLALVGLATRRRTRRG